MHWIAIDEGSFINDVTVKGGGDKGFCDNSTKALVLKSVTIVGGGVKNYPKLRDVIYWWPLLNYFRGNLMSIPWETTRDVVERPTDDNVVVEWNIKCNEDCAVSNPWKNTSKLYHLLRNKWNFIIMTKKNLFGFWGKIRKIFNL